MKHFRRLLSGLSGHPGIPYACVFSVLSVFIAVFFDQPLAFWALPLWILAILTTAYIYALEKEARNGM